MKSWAGEEPAGTFVREALKNGKHVVTGNKELIAKSGPALFKEADSRDLDIMFEASVGGGIPVIGPLRRDLLANQIDSIRAIINGTTNYIVTRMAQEGADYAEVLADATELGYAEPDPTADVEGHDAAYKLSIMASLGFRTRVAPEDVQTEGISKLSARDFQYAEELGYVIKLLAVAERDEGGIVCRVSPTLLAMSEPLAKVDGVYNAVEITGDLSGQVMFQGAGAGADPTTSAVIADLLDLSHAMVLGNNERKYWGPVEDLPVVAPDDLETRFYIRVTVSDRPGVLAQIAHVLGEAGVSIAAVNQKEAFEEDRTAELVIMTHKASERSVRGALEEIRVLEVVPSVDAVFRVEGGQ